MSSSSWFRTALWLACLGAGTAWANPFLREARAAFARKQHAEALALLDKAATWQDPRHDTEAQVALERGLVYVAMKRPVSGKRAFTDALLLKPDLRLPPDAPKDAQEMFALAKQEAAPALQAATKASEPGPSSPSLEAEVPASVPVAPLTVERPPAGVRTNDLLTASARFEPLLYWHRVSAAGRSHVTPMVLPGARFDFDLHIAKARIGVDYGFSYGGVRLLGDWVAAQLHDLDVTLGTAFSTAFIRRGTLLFLEAGYSGTVTRFANHFPRHLTNDTIHRLRLGAGWQAAFYLWNLEVQLELAGQLYPYARLFEFPVASGTFVPGFGLGASSSLQFPLAGRVFLIVGADVRWTAFIPEGLSTRPSFNLERVASLQQLMATGSLGFLFPF